MSLEDFNLFAINLESVHLFECRLQIICTIKAHFTTTLANPLMGIRVGDLATLAEDILQLAPAAARRQIVNCQTVSGSVWSVTAATTASPRSGAGSRTATTAT